jgi:hypothetical protein
VEYFTLRGTSFLGYIGMNMMNNAKAFSESNDLSTPLRSDL